MQEIPCPAHLVPAGTPPGRRRPGARRRTPRRPAARRALLAVLVAAPLAVPAVADAKTVRSSNVTVFGKEAVNCYVVAYGGNGIECTSGALPRTQLDGYIALRRTGKTRLGERGDYPGYDVTQRRLAVGDAWRPGHGAKGIVCRFESQGLRCKNRTGHGFVLTPDAYRRF